MARAMKDSGIEWIGEIPECWNYTKMKYIGQYVNGYAFKPEQWSSYGIPIIRIQDLTGSSDNPNFYNYELDLKYLIDKGDILVSWAATLNAYIWNKGKAWLNQHIFKAIPNSKVVEYEFFYWILKEAMQNMNNDNKHGIVMQHVTLDVFNNFVIPLPLKAEQQRIASFLDSKCQEIDNVLAKTRASIEEYKKLKQAIITKAVTKGIRSNRKMKDSGIEWIKSIPENWDIVPAKSLFKLRKEKARENDEQLTASQNMGIVNQKLYMELTGQHVVTVEKDFDILKHVEPGDFVISMRSFQGGIEYSSVRGCISSAYVMLIPDSTKVFDGFYKWLFKSALYINALQGTSNLVRDGQALRYSNFAQVPLCSIPLDEQKEISNYLDVKCFEIDNLISKKEQLITELESYKKSLIYEYVTGKKEVPMA